MDKLLPYLNSLDNLTAEIEAEKTAYIAPALKRLGSVALVLVREIVAPTVFRNLDAEMTDMEIDGRRVLRAVPNKTKYAERARGLQILRHFDAGGRFPQNKTTVPAGKTPGYAFDLNSFVFGDSGAAGGKVYPVKASFLYSDALGISDYDDCVSETFHNRAADDGTLFDAEKKENSTNIFTRHFVKPGTLMVQTISTHGRVATPEALRHLLLCLGEGGAYAGQTSISGVNIRTHIAGAFAGRVERPIVAPGELLKSIWKNELPTSASDLCARLEAIVGKEYEVTVSSAEMEAVRRDALDSLDRDDESLVASYKETAAAMSALYDDWFGIARKVGK